MTAKLTLLAFFLIPISIFAQSPSYNEKAAEIKKNIWEKPNPLFNVNTVPEKYNNEGAVVLARSFEMQRISGGKFKFMLITATSVTRTNKTVTFREKVKINDKTALEKFSKLEYQKVIDKTQSILFIKARNKREVYIGAKITKPNGKETIVDISEELILADTDKDKKGKLAIPGLQVGDILDYYISTIQVLEGMDQQEDDNKYLFVLADEYPVLNYSYTLQYNKKVNVFHISANGAPNLVQTTNDEKDQILTLKGKDMPKYDDELWSSPLRELPYFAVSSYFSNAMDQIASHNYDRYDKKLSRLDNFIKDFQIKFNPTLYPFDYNIREQTKDYFKSSKAFRAAPLDSTMKLFYNVWKFNTFFSYYNDNFDVADKRYTTANSKINAIIVSQMLSDLAIPHDILITSSRFSNSLSNVFEDDDIEALIRIHAPKPLYMTFYRVNTLFNEIPVAFQGEKAIVLTPKRHNKNKYSFTRSETTIPTTSAEDNNLTEKLVVNFVATDMQKLNIARTVKEKQFMRLSDQLGLLLFEDLDNELKAMVDGKGLKSRLSDAKKPKKTIENYTAAFDAARKDVKKSFIDELTAQYGETPKEITGTKILNSGLNDNNPALEYSSNFTIETLTKKAGNNYILNIGKLIGDIAKVEDEKKARQTNIYMPAARSLNYNIDIIIPKGYKINGIEELNVNTKNDVGSFSVSTKLSAEKLTLDIKRVYTKPQVDKQQWSDVVALLNAAWNFTEKKVLLESLAK
jgi:hypothetical protein